MNACDVTNNKQLIYTICINMSSHNNFFTHNMDSLQILKSIIVSLNCQHYNIYNQGDKFLFN